MKDEHFADWEEIPKPQIALEKLKQINTGINIIQGLLINKISKYVGRYTNEECSKNPFLGYNAALLSKFCLLLDGAKNLSL